MQSPIQAATRSNHALHVRELLAVGAVDRARDILEYIDLVFSDCHYPLFGHLLRIN
jgi:hypothetical protein